jgi:hypothetical protein
MQMSLSISLMFRMITSTSKCIYVICYMLLPTSTASDSDVKTRQLQKSDILVTFEALSSTHYSILSFQDKVCSRLQVGGRRTEGVSPV